MSDRELLSAQEFSGRIMNLASGKLAFPEANEKVEIGIPLAVTGSPLLESDLEIFDDISALGGQVVLDATESGEWSLPGGFDFSKDPVVAITEAYFDSLPEIFRRPNKKFYEQLKKTVSARGIQGIIVRYYPCCDLWQAEVARIKTETGLPVLELEVAMPANPARIQGRIQAFLEMLQA